MKFGQFGAVGCFIGHLPIACALLRQKSGAVAMQALPSGADVAGGGKGAAQFGDWALAAARLV